MHDIKHAFRQFILRPGLSAIVIAMLALGIGATTAIFSLFHQILMQPLPVPAPEQLVNLSAPGPKYGPVWGGNAVGDGEATFTYEMFRDLEAQQTVFTGIAAHSDFWANVNAGGQTSSGRGMLVSGSYFAVLNLQPALGRLIGTEDEPRVDESAVAVLSHDYWQSRFGGDPNVVDQTLTVNGQSLTIIGVAPEGFAGAALGWRPQVFVPLTLRWLMQPNVARDYESRRSYWVYLFARLNAGITIEQATAALNGVYSGILRDVEGPMLTSLPDAEMQRFLERRVTVEPGARGQSYLPAIAEQPLTLLLGVAALLVLIICVNVANLLLARGASRTGEMAIRASVGASRGQLLSQLLIESTLLAATGGMLSIVVAVATLRAVTALVPEALANGLAVSLSSTAMLFAAGAALATVLLFGLAPAWQASDTDPGRVIKGEASQSSSGRGMVRFRATLTTVQIAFSMVLLVLAGLFTQSLMNIARVNLGIDVESLVSFSVSPRLNGYAPDEVSALYDRIEEELAAQPGVRSVASAGIPLIAHRSMGYQVSGTGFEWTPGVNNFSQSNMVSPGFFATASIPLLAGREFTVADRLGSPPVAIVNESFVRRFDLGTAVGERFSLPFVVDDIEIVGVVADAKYTEVKGDVQPQFFQPRRQATDLPALFFYVRGGIDSDAMIRMIPHLISSIDPDLPVDELTTMEAQVRDNVYIDRLTTMLSVAFAALATLLAAIGLYGVLAYNVTQRTRELGLRLALGATPGTLRGMVLKQVGVMALVGGMMGLAAAVGIGRVAEALLFGLSGYDPPVLLAAVAVLSAVVLAASYLPARRASNIAPMEALRYE